MTSYAQDRIANPTRFFDTPDSVKNDTRLSPEEKVQVLKSMAIDADLKAEATSEGMSGAVQGESADQLQSAQIQLKRTKASQKAKGVAGNFQRILVVTTTNEQLNKETAQAAFNLAKIMKGKVHLLNVVPMLIEGAPLTAAGPMVATATLAVNENAELVDENARQLKTLASELGADVATEVEVRTGQMEPEIVDYANECAADLIVVGSPNRSWLEVLLEPSITDSVTKFAPCPVLVVPQAE